jgi:hypothetical protein
VDPGGEFSMGAAVNGEGSNEMRWLRTTPDLFTGLESMGFGWIRLQ